MKERRLLTIGLSFLLGTGSLASAALLQNGDFEGGLAHWKVTPGTGKIAASPDAARSGGMGIAIARDASEGELTVASEPIPAEAGKKYLLTYFLRARQAGTAAVFLRFLGEDGKVLSDKKRNVSFEAVPDEWCGLDFSALALEGSKSMVIGWTFAAGSGLSLDADDVTIVGETLTGVPPRPPYYKLLLEKDAALTVMDIRGPDGLVYPNWTWAGVQGGIPDVPEVIDLNARGAGEGTDISKALQDAVNELGSGKGGAITLGAGNYYLDRPVFVRGAHNVVIRGAGMSKTRVIFRYKLPKGTVQFYGIEPGQTFERLHIVGNPEGISRLSILVNGRVVKTLARTKDHWGNRFDLGVSREELLGKLDPGKYEFEGVIEYEDGTKAEGTMLAVLSDKPSPNTIYPQFSAISFEGQPPSAEQKIFLAEDGVRGETRLVLASGHGLKPGDYVQVVAPPTDRWDKLSGNVNQSAWALFRANQYRVEEVDGNSVKLNQPLRLEFPKVDGAYAQIIRPVIGCGIEDLTLEQTENLWISGVHFAWSWNCWAKNVKIVKTGRHPLMFLDSKFGEVRGCVYDGALFKGDGGSAYGGFERAYDCLMENVETFSLRHAPIFNWACSGNVVRNSVFHGSNAHWHAGWCNENLFENCVVEATDLRGGMAAIGPKFFKLHGPQGPRNVVYNCDIQVLRAAGNDEGLLMQGMNEHWLIVYNRFVVKKGVGVVMQDHCFDHIIQGNVFCLENARPFVIEFRDDTCSGIEILGNRIFGVVKNLVGGPGQGCLEEGNVIAPYRPVSRPVPPVPSIYEWQKNRRTLSTSR